MCLNFETVEFICLLLKNYSHTILFETLLVALWVKNYWNHMLHP